MSRLRFQLRLSLLVAWALLWMTIFPLVGHAEIATQSEARTVCENWLSITVAQRGDWAGSALPTITDVKEIVRNEDLLGYYFTISPDGYVVVPALKSIAPVKASYDQGQLDFALDGIPALILDDLSRTQDIFKKQFSSLDFVPTQDIHEPFGLRDRDLWTMYLKPSDAFLEGMTGPRWQSRYAGKSGNGEWLLTSAWNQEAPYNSLCPAGDTACTQCQDPQGNTYPPTSPTLVGCVATAAAQVMYYYNWPPSGLGSKSYSWGGDTSCSSNPPNSTLSVTLSDSYDWTHMADVVTSGSSAAAQAAVAELCYEVGVAYEMDYGVCGSGSNVFNGLNVLTKYFNYSEDISREDRSDYTAAEWFDLIVDELQEDRPILYRVEGHAIVCDGWQDTGGVDEFHMNYGWGNSSNSNTWYTIDGLIYHTADEYLLMNIKPDDSDGATAYVMDRSGSMGGFPLAVAKFAANLGITFKKTGSDLAVISFNSSASTNYNLHTITSNDVRVAARSAINSLSAGGSTSIGYGLLAGCQQLVNSAQADRNYVLLSDGQQNAGMTPEQALQSACFQTLNPLDSTLTPSTYSTPIYTIAFGTGADQQLLSQIATLTGGQFLYVPSQSDPLGLADLYLTIEGDISGEQRNGEFSGTISSPQTVELDLDLGADLTEQTVTLVWDSTSDNLDLALVSPSGTLLDAGSAEALGVTYVQGPAIRYFTIPAPEAGRWTARIEALAGTTEYALVLSGQSNIKMTIASNRDEYPRNSTITLLATITENDAPVSGASVSAEVLAPTSALALYEALQPPVGDADPAVRPDLHRSADGRAYLDDAGTAIYTSFPLVLFDDGAHGDGAAGDGIYGGQYADTAAYGTYSFDVHAEGVSPAGIQFVREGSFATVVTQTANAAPIADAGADRTVECEGDGAAMVMLDGSSSSDPDGDTLEYTWSSGGEVIGGPSADATLTYAFSLGSHFVELTVDDGNGETHTDEVAVTVVDTTPPQFSLAASPDVLWPPNHKLVPVEITVVVEDICDEDLGWELVEFISNEDEDGLGDGDTADDIQDIMVTESGITARLRAERSGLGGGRAYRATFSATDASGNTTTASATIHVPHSDEHAARVFGNPPDDARDATVTYAIFGGNMWSRRAPVVDEGSDPGLTGQVRYLRPVSATICNTAGFVQPNQFLVGDVDGDDVPDIVMVFDSEQLKTLRAVSQLEDGDPALLLEMTEGVFTVMSLNEIRTCRLDLAMWAKRLAEAEVPMPDDQLAADSSVPRTACLTGIAPNPFNPMTTISYYLPTASRVRISVFDVRGRLVARLVDGLRQAGLQSIEWNGLGHDQGRVSSGVYFCLMEAGAQHDTRRMIMIK